MALGGWPSHDHRGKPGLPHRHPRAERACVPGPHQRSRGARRDPFRTGGASRTGSGRKRRARPRRAIRRPSHDHGASRTRGGSPARNRLASRELRQRQAPSRHAADPGVPDGRPCERQRILQPLQRHRDRRRRWHQVHRARDDAQGLSRGRDAAGGGLPRGASRRRALRGQRRSTSHLFRGPRGAAPLRGRAGARRPARAGHSSGAGGGHLFAPRHLDRRGASQPGRQRDERRAGEIALRREPAADGELRHRARIEVRRSGLRPESRGPG